MLGSRHGRGGPTVMPGRGEAGLLWCLCFVPAWAAGLQFTHMQAEAAMWMHMHLGSTFCQHSLIWGHCWVTKIKGLKELLSQYFSDLAWNTKMASLQETNSTQLLSANFYQAFTWWALNSGIFHGMCDVLSTACSMLVWSLPWPCEEGRLGNVILLTWGALGSERWEASEAPWQCWQTAQDFLIHECVL